MAAPMLQIGNAAVDKTSAVKGLQTGNRGSPDLSMGRTMRPHDDDAPRAKCLVIVCGEVDKLTGRANELIEKHFAGKVAYAVTVIAVPDASSLAAKCAQFYNENAEFDLIVLPLIILRNDELCCSRGLLVDLSRTLTSAGTLIVLGLNVGRHQSGNDCPLSGSGEDYPLPANKDDIWGTYSVSSSVYNRTPSSAPNSASEAEKLCHNVSCQQRELCCMRNHTLEDVHTLLVIAGFHVGALPSTTGLDLSIPAKPEETELQFTIKAQLSRHLASYKHPFLHVSHSPTKGRLWRASNAIDAGTIILIDPAYAIIPEPVSSDANASLLCSNPHCNRSISKSRAILCPKQCYGDVIWCDRICQHQGAALHNLECTWLARKAARFEIEEGRYKFAVIWLVIRLHIGRVLDRQKATCTSVMQPDQSCKTSAHGGNVISELAGDTTWFSTEQMSGWKGIISTYLLDDSGGSEDGIPLLPAQDWLTLVCQEETNSFGLYKGVTGSWPPVEKSEGRGASFGAAVYPLASIANHSCIPNALHFVDENCRKIYMLSRSIEAGEEVCISYFDLAEVVALKDRNNFLYESFCFFCDCSRCDDEQYLY